MSYDPKTHGPVSQTARRMTDIPEKAVVAADDAYCRATWNRMRAALAAALPHLASSQPQPSNSARDTAVEIAAITGCGFDRILDALTAIRAAALDECEARARGELWFPDKYNSRYRCEVGHGENKDALNWSMEGDYGNARNAAADAIAALKRGPVAEESGE